MNRSILSSALALATVVYGIACPAEDAIHERIEWSDVWIVNANANDRPRVLLAGDSIVKGYYGGVEKLLGEKANCARFATSKFLAHPDYLAELGLIVKRFPFDVIHVNNGLHGWDYSEDQYREGLRALLGFLKQEAPNAKIIWGMSTPIRDSANLAQFSNEKNERVKARNAIAAELTREAEVPADDLYTLVEGHPEYFAEDGVHYNDEGRAVQAKQVASFVESHLPG